jgi:peptidoglycan/LPS O-acetylase OafA/YrhL
MIVEHDQTGRVNLRHFYARRAFRILPVYFGFLLTLGMLQWFTPYALNRIGWIGNLTFTRNFIGSDFPSDHLWSLSVEEQFYVLWPTLFAVFGLTADSKILRILAIPILVAPVARVMGYKQFPALLAPIFRGQSFFSYFDALAVGCACAVLLSRYREPIEKYFKARPRGTFVVGLTLLLVTYVLFKLSPKAAFLRTALVPLGPTAQAFGFAILVLQSIISPQWGVYRMLNFGWIRQIGVLSYSIYIWQQLFCTTPQTFGLGHVWWMSFPFWLLPVFTLAFVSYYGFERPFLGLRARFRKA